MEVIPITEKNISGHILNQGDWKLFEQEIKFSDTELLRVRLTFNKKTGEGIIRACTFWENYQNELKRTSKDIEFIKKIKKSFNDIKFEFENDAI